MPSSPTPGTSRSAWGARRGGGGGGPGAPGPAGAIELVTELNLIQQRPKLAAAIRRRGRTTARAYTWEKVIEQLLLRIEFAAAQQAVRVPVGEPADVEMSRRRPRRS